VAVTRDEWIEQFASLMGVEPPSGEQVGAMLKLAAVAAHASERTAAPVACYIAGATGKPLGELIALAEQVAGPEASE
jgi:Domain of unknown function (DUF6457)